MRIAEITTRSSSTSHVDALPAHDTVDAAGMDQWLLQQEARRLARRARGFAWVLGGIAASLGAVLGIVMSDFYPPVGMAVALILIFPALLLIIIAEGTVHLSFGTAVVQLTFSSLLALGIVLLSIDSVENVHWIGIGIWLGLFLLNFGILVNTARTLHKLSQIRRCRIQGFAVEPVKPALSPDEG